MENDKRKEICTFGLSSCKQYTWQSCGECLSWLKNSSSKNSLKILSKEEETTFSFGSAWCTLHAGNVVWSDERFSLYICVYAHKHKLSSTKANIFHFY